MRVGAQRLRVRLDQRAHEKTFARLATVGVCRNGLVKDGTVFVALVDCGDGTFLEIVTSSDYASDGRRLMPELPGFTLVQLIPQNDKELWHSSAYLNRMPSTF